MTERVTVQARKISLKQHLSEALIALSAGTVDARGARGAARRRDLPRAKHYAIHASSRVRTVLPNLASHTCQCSDVQKQKYDAAFSV